MATLSAPQPDPAQAAEFITAWHGTEGLISIVAMQPGKHSALRPLVEEVPHFLRLLGDGLEGLIYADGNIWNVYHSASRLKEKPPVGKRGGRKYIADAPGIWLDLDVKEGGLESYEAAWSLAWALGEPTLIVATGTGGLHPYWKTKHRLSPSELELLGAMWQAHAEAVSGVGLDRVSNSDRVLRTPGSIRWPKEGEAPTLCRLIHRDGPVYDAAALRDVAQPAYAERQRVVAETRRTVLAGSNHAELFLRGDLSHPWMRLMAIAQLESWFCQKYTWESILRPLGWEVEGTDPDGRVIWARPGSHSRRSATTDWPQSPDVMSLLTRAPETGLVQLHDAGVALSKYRVYCQLWWNGDEPAMAEKLLEDWRADAR